MSEVLRAGGDDSHLLRDKQMLSQCVKIPAASPITQSGFGGLLMLYMLRVYFVLKKIYGCNFVSVFFQV